MSSIRGVDMRVGSEEPPGPTSSYSGEERPIISAQFKSHAKNPV